MMRHRLDPPAWVYWLFGGIAYLMLIAGASLGASLAYTIGNPFPSEPHAVITCLGGALLGALPGSLALALVYRFLP